MLRFSTTFASPLAAPSARNAMVQWLQSIGYRLTSPPFLSSIALERGSLMGNMGSLGPNRWSAKVHATFAPQENGCEVTVEWVVNTFGQIGTKADMAFWRSEALWTLSAACGIMPDPRDHIKATSRALSGNVWRALVFTVVLLFPSIAFGVISGSIYVGLLVCAVAGVICWQWLRAPREINELAPPPPQAEAPPVLR